MCAERPALHSALVGVVAEAFFGQGFFRTLIILTLAFLWGFALYDLAKRPASGVSKAVWVLVIVFLPVLGTMIYLISRPGFATDTNPVEQGEFQGREREEMAIEMTRGSSS